jgi:hypothetical protein
LLYIFNDIVTPDETCTTPATAVFRKTTSKVRSASHTDTELEEEEEEEEETQVCKWDTCTIELNSLDELINHVKADHIGSGKANYYCLWKDCARNQKPFTKRHKMHNHLRTHTGERPFVCQEPGMILLLKTYINNNNLFNIQIVAKSFRDLIL